MHFMQLSGWSFTLLAAGKILEEQDEQVMSPGDTGADSIALFTWSILYWLLAIWLVVIGSMKFLTSHAAADVPGDIIEEL